MERHGWGVRFYLVGGGVGWSVRVLVHGVGFWDVLVPFVYGVRTRLWFVCVADCGGF